MTPDQRREKAREIVQQLKESSAGSRTQRALNRSETVSRLPRRQETASVLSTSTITRKDGKSGKIVSRCESTTSVTISKNYNNSSNAVAKKSPPAVIERSDKQILVNGKSKSAASYPIRKKSETTLSRSKVQLLSKPNDEGLTATPVRAQSTASNRSPSPVGRKVYVNDEEDEVERRQRLLQERKTKSIPSPTPNQTQEQNAAKVVEKKERGEKRTDKISSQIEVTKKTAIKEKPMRQRKEVVRKISPPTPAIIVTSPSERVRKKNASSPMTRPLHAAGLESIRSASTPLFGERISARVDLESGMRRHNSRTQQADPPLSRSPIASDVTSVIAVRPEKEARPHRKVLFLLALLLYFVVLLFICYPPCCCPFCMIHLLMTMLLEILFSDLRHATSADDCCSIMNPAYSCPV
jgi:hypothetical protein